MAKRKVANPLAFAVLGSLGERPMHPYEISSLLKGRGKEVSIKLNYGSLYSVVAALEKAGFIEAVETLRDGNRPERTVYAITESGRAEFDDWLTELLGTPAKEFRQLEAGLAYLPAFPPDRVVELLEQRVVALDEEIAQLVGMHEFMQSKKFPRIFWVESEFRVAVLTAERDYAKGLAAEIRVDGLEGSAFWRRTHELVAELGIKPRDVLQDPVKYFGEDLPWLKEVPPEGL
ncbi:PadR family transcriptional regulator [Kribbella monticola]|uniref:PadR family transcriptional regulator n=1 Tax=Kribbella monticola TaxID=2185285 RepID=UPI000DD37323|nr:PadR family transcriptional regulator [Kribbella monticola]